MHSWRSGKTADGSWFADRPSGGTGEQPQKIPRRFLKKATPCRHLCHPPPAGIDALTHVLRSVDNSEWMRNGDYIPTRMESQADAVNLICNVKTQQNPESTVGVMTSAGRCPEVLVTPTQDLGKILTALHNVRITGSTNFVSTIQVAQLALKHRQNKNQRQRIIAFVGSPLEDDQKDLVKLGKKLKKNNVAIDVINFGETAENQEKLEAFIGAVNSNENSNLLTVPPGPHILSDIIISSPILQDGEGGGAGMAMAMGGGEGGGGDFEFGVDPRYDPDLAMALRISAEEERQRQERESKSTGEGTTASAGGDPFQTPSGAATAAGGDAMDEDEIFQQAIAMSMQEASGGATPATPAAVAPAAAAASGGMEVSPGTMAAIGAMDEEDEELKLAMQMSMGAGDAQPSSGLLQDPGFLSNVLSSLPGVDTSDPRVQDVLKDIKKDKEDEKK